MKREGEQHSSENLLMKVGVVELLRNLPLYGGGFVSPLIRDLESRRYVLAGQSVWWALVNATSRHCLRLFCGGYGQIECKNLYVIWRRNHGERSMYRQSTPSALSSGSRESTPRISQMQRNTKHPTLLR